MKAITSVILATLFAATQATQGIDISQLVSTSGWQCLKNAGYSFAIPRAWCSYGGFDKNAVTNIHNAKAAGIPFVDVYMFPCRGKSASQQVADLISNLGSASYGQIWVDVETNPSSGCSWASYSGASNCQYLSETISAIKSHGKVPGAGACSALSGVTLWYAHYDNSASFSDFKSFGGWSRPNIKQFKGDTTACGVGVDLNYY